MVLVLLCFLPVVLNDESENIGFLCF